MKFSTMELVMINVVSSKYNSDIVSHITVSIGADFLSIFVLNIPRIFFNIAIFFLENFNLALHYN